MEMILEGVIGFTSLFAGVALVVGMCVVSLRLLGGRK